MQMSLVVVLDSGIIWSSFSLTRCHPQILKHVSLHYFCIYNHLLKSVENMCFKPKPQRSHFLEAEGEGGLRR